MKSFTLVFIALFLFIVSIMSVLGYTGGAKLAKKKDFSRSTYASCRVMIIFDGDTFGCDFDGDRKIINPTEHVRMLGIDTTEMHYSAKNLKGKDEPFALEAKIFVETAILDTDVYLEFDKERHDRHNRLLAYVYKSPEAKHTSVMLNSMLLEEGLAKTLFIGNNRRYEADFQHVEQEARLHRRKLWSLSL